MPKMRTNGSAKKRFKVSPSGKIKRKRPFASHILTKKTQKRKRNLRKTEWIDDNDMQRVKRLLG